jgi:hypothetical protein
MTRTERVASSKSTKERTDAGVGVGVTVKSKMPNQSAESNAGVGSVVNASMRLVRQCKCWGKGRG